MKEKMSQFVNIVMQDKAVQTIVGFAGGNTQYNTGRMFITLKPLNQRKESADRIIARLRKELAVVPGATLYMQSAQDLTIGGRQSQAQFQYTLQGENLDDLNNWSPRLLQKLRTLPELRDVNTDQQDKGLEAQVIIDRDTAARLGVAAADIDNALYDAFGQRQVSIMYRQLNQYHVVMEVAPEFARSPEALENIYVRVSNGTAVPLATFARFGPSNTPLAVNHQGQYPSVTLSFNLAQNVSLGQATQVIENAERSIGFPSTIKASFQGTAAAFQQSLANEPILILAALATVYIVLGVLYESYIHPITILSTLPSAGVGAILALKLTNDELNVMGQIGIILLIGLVKKNAIMMINFGLETERTAGKNSTESIYEACILRFRPIMMTTMAAMLGGLPLALGAGTGSELSRPLGITIVGGLIVSQALTLFTTPVVYIYIDRLRLWSGRQRATRPGGAGASAPNTLAASRRPQDSRDRHFGESLFAAQRLFPAPMADNQPPVDHQRPTANNRVIDVGSGAGFPGIPTKIWAPQVHLTLIESNQKKAIFLKEVARALTLTNIDAVAARAENFSGQAGIVTLRAVERFEAILPIAARLVVSGGVLALLVGERQLKSARQFGNVFRWSEPLQIPLSSKRVLLLGDKEPC